jgi:hypothetical protein
MFLAATVAVVASAACNPASTGPAGYPFDGTWRASADAGTGWDSALVTSTQQKSLVSGTVLFTNGTTTTFAGNETFGIVTFDFGTSGLVQESFTGTFITADTISGAFYGGVNSMKLIRLPAGSP